MGRKSLLVSPELCIGCRGCQTACKEWNQLPGSKTENRGSFENPPELTATTLNRVRYVEVASSVGDPRWLFVSQRCMHCGDAACMNICPSTGAINRTPDGAVTVDKTKCIECKLCASACPFGTPKFDAHNKMSKCQMCADRTASGLPPACAKTCPTGALRYGGRDELIASAKKAGYAKIYGENDLGGLGTLYAFRDEPRLYGMDEKPAMPESLIFWQNVLKPLSYLGLGGALALSLMHYVAVGPKKDGEDGKDSGEVNRNG